MVKSKTNDTDDSSHPTICEREGSRKSQFDSP